MAEKAAFLSADFQALVSENWVVETVDIELAAHHAVIELVSKGDKAQKSGYVPQVREQRPRKSKKLTHMSLKLP